MDLVGFCGDGVGSGLGAGWGIGLMMDWFVFGFASVSQSDPYENLVLALCWNKKDC